MRTLVAGLIVLVALPPLLLAGGVGLILLAGGAGAADTPPSGHAIADIPDSVLAAYQHAAQARCPGLSWTVLAGVGKLEANHARHGGAAIDPAGYAVPWIIGPPLDGGPGVRAIPDTDGGRWDRDPVWDRAVGPMQFIPATWRGYAVDAGGGGHPHHLGDAVHAAARYLCTNGGGDPATVRQALFAYNRSWDYVDRVLAIAASYTDAALVLGDYTLPVARDLLTVELLRRSHHDYPAWDLAVPVGTPVYAVHRGHVITTPAADSRCGLGVVIRGDDGATYSYCHGSAVHVRPGQHVTAGQVLMASGNTGRSTGPHLHLGIRWQHHWVCPQPLLEAWWHGRPAHPANAPTSGCTH